MNIPFEDLKPYDPAGDLVDRIIGEMKKDAPVHKAMADLHRENVQLLKEIIALEETMKKQKTVAAVKGYRRSIANLRKKVNRNNEKIQGNINVICKRW